MSLRFVACRSCARHVRDRDARCPFCGATRVALASVALGASLVLAGCGSATTLPSDDAGSDASAQRDTGASDAAHDASESDGEILQTDSGPPPVVDAGPYDGGAIPIYGAPPTPGGPRWGKP